MKNILTTLIFSLLLTISVFAQSPTDRIQRSGGKIQVGSDGSVTVTLATGRSLTINYSTIISGMAAPSVSSAGQAKIYFDSTTKKLRVSEDGGAYTNVINTNVENPLTFNAPLSRSVNAISISQSDATHNGYLSSTDWNTFNSKQPALGFTPFDAANVDTDSTFAANSDTKVPSQKAVKARFDALPVGVTGSGTTNNLAKFTAAGVVGDSRITDDGSSIINNIGTTEDNNFIITNGSQELFKIRNDGGGNPQLTLGSTDTGILNGTNIAIVDAVKTITQLAGTESIAIDGVGHTITNTAATSFSVVSPLFGAGDDGQKFQINDLGRIVKYQSAAPNNGELFIGNAGGGRWQTGTLTPGTGISVTNGAGSITISTTGASPTASYLAADYTNATASFTNIALSVTLGAGKKYSFVCQVFVSDSVAADGFSIDFNGGSATATNFIAGTSTSLVTGVTTGLTGTYSNGTVTGTNLLTISGSIEVNAGGTFIVRAKQSSHTAGTLTVSRGSTIVFTEIL